MRFTGTPGFDAQSVTPGSANGTAAVAPAVTTLVDNSVVVRMASYDNNLLAPLNPTTIMTSNNNATQGRSGGDPANSTSASAVWINQATAGGSGTPTFMGPTTAEDYRTFALSLPPYQLCTGSNSIFSTGPIQYEGCAQRTIANATGLTLVAPGATAIGDYLVAVVSVDGNVSGSIAMPGWTLIEAGTSNGTASTMAVYGFTATGAGASTHGVTWTGAQEAFGYIMRFTGTEGLGPEATATTATIANPSTPAVTTTVNNSLIVRMGGFDNNLLALNPGAGTILTGLNNITQGRSSGDPANSAAAAAGWINQITAGSSGTVNFANTSAEDSISHSISLLPRRLCTGTNGIASGGTGNVAEFAGCEQRTGNNLSNIDVPAPSATAVGDYLVAVVATDGNPTMTTPTGWTVINVGVSNTNDATLAVYGRMAATAGAGPYNFAWTGSTQDVFAYVMRFTNAAGVYATEVASAVADSANASTPTITTTVPNTLVVRVGAFDNQLVNLNPAAGGIITGHNNITQGRSAPDPANAVSSGAAWISQAVAGVSGTATFTSAPTAIEQTRTVTFGIRPIQRCLGTNSLYSTGPVQYEGCSQTEAAGNNVSITLTQPPGTVAGDYLLAMVTVDGNKTITEPAGWTAIDEGLSNLSANTVGFYTRVADATTNHNFTWTGNEEAFGTIMRFTGTESATPFATSTGNGPNVSTPAVVTTIANSLIVRMGAL